MEHYVFQLQATKGRVCIPEKWKAYIIRIRTGGWNIWKAD